MNCNEIVELDQCTTTALAEINKKCIWVEEETNGQKCQEIQTSCEDITTAATCEEEGAAFSETNQNDISCIWIIKSDEENGGECKAMVCIYIYLIILFIYFFIIF
jgi:hypothetical protein